MILKWKQILDNKKFRFNYVVITKKKFILISKNSFCDIEIKVIYYDITKLLKLLIFWYQNEIFLFNIKLLQLVFCDNEMNYYYFDITRLLF